MNVTVSSAMTVIGHDVFGKRCVHIRSGRARAARARSPAPPTRRSRRTQWRRSGWDLSDAGEQLAAHGALALRGLPPLFVDLAGRLDVGGAELDDLNERHNPNLRCSAPGRSRRRPLPLDARRCPPAGFPDRQVACRGRGHRLATPQMAQPCRAAPVFCSFRKSRPGADRMQIVCARCGEG